MIHRSAGLECNLIVANQKKKWSLIGNRMYSTGIKSKEIMYSTGTVRVVSSRRSAKDVPVIAILVIVN